MTRDIPFSDPEAATPNMEADPLQLKAWLDSFLRHSSIGVVILDRECRVVSCNRSFTRIFGYEKGDMVGKPLDDLITCDECVKDAVALTERALSGLVCHDTVVRHRKDRSPVDVEIRGIPVGPPGEVIGFWGFYREVSELKATEEALRRSEELFRSFAEDAPFGMSITNPDLKTEYVNPKFTEIFGYTIEDIPDKNTWFEKAYPDPAYREMVVDIWTKDTLGDVLIGEVRPRIFSVRCKKGVDKIIHFRAVVTRDRRRLMTYEDITSRAESERALRQSEERYRRLYDDASRREQLYRSLLQSSADAVIIYDLKGAVQYVSPAFTDLFGWTLDELAGKAVPYVPEPERERTAELIRALNDNGLPHSGFETARTTKGGDLIQVSLSASRYDDHEGKPSGILVMLRDISEQKKMEARLSQAHKMEAIGTLADGIAHDFNNILQAISGYAQLLLMKKPQSGQEHSMLTAIERSVRRAGELTERLLIFSRKVESRLRPVDLNNEVRQSLLLLERTIPKMIDIRTDLADDLKVINADPTQLEQVIMNMAVNAMDAMPEGGSFTLRTSNVSLDKSYCALHPGLEPGEYVLFEVTDTGHGIDPGLLDHIYEPFFTTKAVGHGTGLGLAMVYGIVKNHNGAIICSSSPGQGTTFLIYLPVPATGDESGTEAPKEDSAQGGDESILVVDDEENILDIAGDVLERYGYKAITASSGEDALEIYRAGKGRIDLVILDLNMPGMGGKKCLLALKEMDPELKVIVATGHTTIAQAGAAIELGAARFIPKPYRLMDLLKAVREVLDGGS